MKFITEIWHPNSKSMVLSSLHYSLAKHDLTLQLRRMVMSVYPYSMNQVMINGVMRKPVSDGYPFILLKPS